MKIFSCITFSFCLSLSGLFLPDNEVFAQGNLEIYNTVGVGVSGEWTNEDNWTDPLYDPPPLIVTNSSNDFEININSYDSIFHGGNLGQYDNKLTLNVKPGACLYVRGDFLVHTHLVFNVEENGTVILEGKIKLHTNGRLDLNGDLYAGGIEGQSNNEITGYGNLHVPPGSVSGINLETFDGAIVDNPLPVGLLSFTVDVSTMGVMLQWQTVSEINSRGFEIQRFKMPDREWEVLGWRDAAYYSDGINKYQFIDSAPLSGLNYYRLKQLDYDGEYKLFGPLVIDSGNVINEGFLINKKPEGWQVFLPDNSCYLVEVFDFYGNRLFSGEGENLIFLPAYKHPVIVQIMNELSPRFSTIIF